MTYEELLAALEAATDLTAQAELVRAAWANLSAQERTRLQQESSDFAPELQPIVLELQRTTAGATIQAGLDEAATDTAVQRDIEARTQAADLNQNGQIDPEEMSAAAAAGVPDYQSQPGWMYDEYGILTDEQRQEMVEEANFWRSTNFATWDQLLASGMLNQPYDDIRLMVDAVLRDDNPEMEVVVNLAGERKVTIPEHQWATTQERYGLNPRQLQKMIAFSDRYGPRDAYGDLPAWQITIALFKTAGLLDSYTRGRPEREGFLDKIEGRGISRELSSGWGSADPSVVAAGRRAQQLSSDPFAEPYGVFPNEDWSRDPATLSFTRPDQAPNLSPQIARAEGIPLGPQQASGQQLLDDFARGQQLYDDPGVAFVYAFDPALAYRVVHSGGDLSRMHPGDQQKVSRIIGNSGALSRADWRALMSQMGYAEAEVSGATLFDAVWDRMAASEANANAGPGADDGKTYLPDPVGIDETLRTLWQNMFGEEPDSSTLAKFRAQINSAARSAKDDGLSGVDITARAQQFLREDPLYSELYGKNQGSGLSDAEYQAQMEYAQRSMLGGERAGNIAQRAGMRTGQYQTAVGAAIGTEEAWDNSTFLGRLARAADVVGAYT